MSKRDVLRMNDAEVQAMLSERRTMYVTSFNKDGSAHLVPMLYMIDGGYPALSASPTSRKIVNLRRDPRVTCLVETGTDFAELRAVQIVGVAEILDDLNASIRATLGITARYSGVQAEDLEDNVKEGLLRLARIRVTVIVKPERIISWDHRKWPGVTPADIGG
jgi:nitroimidazol reductase NimA-like FMN-containing flavoprotein (pyridoxamine 5'-phosphate oxidase superfamily)